MAAGTDLVVERAVDLGDDPSACRARKLPRKQVYLVLFGSENGSEVISHGAAKARLRDGRLC